MDVKEEHKTELCRILGSSSLSPNYDLLQKAIILNNTDAVIYCLIQKVYPDTYHPKCNGYLHLACKLGRDSIVNTLLECRPQDFYHRSRVCYPNSCLHEDEACMESKLVATITLTGLLPLDISVAFKQVMCIHALVKGMAFRTHQKQLTFLCDYNNPEALALFLKVSAHPGEIKNAYHHCLLKKRDRCLQVLLDTGYNDFYISGMNPYHILFQYTSGFNRHVDRHDNLCATVSCLLQKGIDVHECRPAGSYPLYSLLDYIMKDCGAYGEEYYSASVSRELLSSLKLLLKQGVRLDLDEVYITLSRKDEDERTAYGRELFKSVFDVISSNAESLLTISVVASEIIRDCVDILLSQAQHVKVRPSDLTGLIKLLVRASRSRSVCRNLESAIYRLLCQELPVSTPIQLPYGVNCSYMTTYLVCQYLEALCDRPYSEGDTQSTLSGNPVLRWLVNSMTYSSLCSSRQINIRTLSSKGSHTLTPQLVRFVTTTPLVRLKTLSAKTIYFAVGRSNRKIHALPLPKEALLLLLAPESMRDEKSVNSTIPTAKSNEEVKFEAHSKVQKKEIVGFVHAAEKEQEINNMWIFMAAVVDPSCC